MAQSNLTVTQVKRTFVTPCSAEIWERQRVNFP